MEENEYRAKRESELLKAASNLINRIGSVLDHVRKIHGILCEFDLDRMEDFLTFKVVASESDHLPSEETRSLWNSDALRDKDQEIASIEDFYQPQIINAAIKLTNYLESTHLQANRTKGAKNEELKVPRSRYVNWWAIWTICIFIILILANFLRIKL